MLALTAGSGATILVGLQSLWLSPEIQIPAYTLAAGLADQPTPRNFGALDELSKGSLQHTSKHLESFRALDPKVGLADVVALGKQIASNEANLIGTPGGRRVFTSPARSSTIPTKRPKA